MYVQYTGNGKQPRLLICSRRNECGQKRERQGGGMLLTGYLLFRPASWPLGCLLGKAEEIMTIVFSPWDGGEGAGRERQLCMYVCTSTFHVCRWHVII